MKCTMSYLNPSSCLPGPRPQESALIHSTSRSSSPTSHTRKRKEKGEPIRTRTANKNAFTFCNCWNGRMWWLESHAEHTEALSSHRCMHIFIYIYCIYAHICLQFPHLASIVFWEKVFSFLYRLLKIYTVPTVLHPWHDLLNSPEPVLWSTCHSCTPK